MKELLQNYRNQLEGRIGATDAYRKGKQEIEANYAGELLKKKQEELKKAYDTTVATFRNEFRPMARSAFDRARQEITKAASKPISPALRDSLSAFEGTKLSEAERTMILEMTKNSYAARKRAIEILGASPDDLPPSLDEVLNQLNSLETVVMRSLDKPLQDYEVRVIANGDWVTKVQTMVNEFCECYGKDE